MVNEWSANSWMEEKQTNKKQQVKLIKAEALSGSETKGKA